jgi:cell division protein FtsB
VAKRLAVTTATETARKRSPKRKRRTTPRRLRRLLPILVLAAVAYAYYKPLSSWMHTRHALAQRRGQVAALERQKHALEAAVEQASTDAALARRARRIGLVEPGERLFIVKGIPAWERAHASGK